MSDMENKNVKIDTVSVNNTTPKQTDTSDADTAQTDANAAPATTPDDQIAALADQVRELNDKYLRTAAELENTRRRASIDADASARRRAMSISGHFLPVMDAVQAALSHTPDDEGIQSLARAITSAFAQIGIVKINTIGEQLNPQFHNAIQAIPAPAGQAPNTIIEEMQAGYMFGDAVLRPAMVIVAK